MRGSITLFFRHLEWELSRLKHKDPLRKCEISEDDIFFHPQGNRNLLYDDVDVHVRYMCK